MRSAFTLKLLGASLLSAAGSLPQHFLPVLTAVLIADGRFGPLSVGAVASTCLAGQLLAGIGLPVVGLVQLHPAAAAAAALAIVVALQISTDATYLVVLSSWLAIGFASGCLQFLGATTAARSPDKPRAFAIRLAVILAMAGTAIVAIQLVIPLASYEALSRSLMIAFGLACALGLWMYTIAPRREDTTRPSSLSRASPVMRTWLGLAAVVLFFAGQIGFWSFVFSTARSNGIELSHAVLISGLCKILAAICVTWTAQAASGSRHGVTVLLGSAVALSVLTMSFASNTIVFFAALLFWELALNPLSARLQASVASANPDLAGAWLTGAILFGAAIGPVLHAAAIQLRAGDAFLLAAALSAMIVSLLLPSIRAA